MIREESEEHALRQRIMVQNRKVPHWAADLSQQVNPQAVRDAANHARIAMDDVTNSEARIDIHAEARFLQACADQTGNPFFGAMSAMNGQYTPQVAAFVLKYSPTLGKGMEAGAKLIPAVDPTTRLTLHRDGDRTVLRIACDDGFLMNQFQHREFFTFGLIALFREVTGIHIMPLKVRFAHARGASGQDLACQMGFPVEFGCDATDIILKNTTLDLPILSCDEALLSFLVQQGETVLASRSRDKPDIVAQTEQRLVNALPQRWLEADDVARDLGLSRRTYSRRLSQLGVNFKSVSEGLRQDLAKTYLKDPAFSLAEIAFLLCFSDQSAFTAAFKRWTSQTPGVFRAASQSA